MDLGAPYYSIHVIIRTPRHALYRYLTLRYVEFGPTDQRVDRRLFRLAASVDGAELLLAHKAREELLYDYVNEEFFYGPVPDAVWRLVASMRCTLWFDRLFS